MPRNASGVYSLPAGNPVSPNTPILASWANSTATDIATELTNSLDRYGRGAMLAAFKNNDGTIGAPGITFGNEASTGISRTNTGEMNFSGTGVERARINSIGLTIPFSAGKVVANRFDAYDQSMVLNTPTGFGTVFRINNVDKMTLNSAGQFGIGIAPAASLHVAGNIRLQGGSVLTEWYKADGSARLGYMQGNDAGGASNLSIVAEIGSVKIATGGADRTTWNSAGGLAHTGTFGVTGASTLLGALTQSGGDFNFVGAGVVDSTAARVFSSGGNLVLQNGSGDATILRNKLGNNHSVWTNSGNLSVGFAADQGEKLAVNGNAKVTNTLLAGGASGEPIRMLHDTAFMSSYNSLGTVRTGYLAFNAAGDILLMRDGAAGIMLGTNGVNRWYCASNGHFTPVLNATYNIGSSGLRAATVFSTAADVSGDVLAGTHSLASGLGQLWSRSTTHAVLEALGSAGLQLAQNGAVRIDIGTKSSFNTGALVNPSAPAHSGTPTFSCQTSNTFLPAALTSNITAVTLTNPTDGQFITIRFQQDGTGGRSINLGNLGAISTPVIAGAPATGSLKVSYLNVMYHAGSNRWEGAWTVLP